MRVESGRASSKGGWIHDINGPPVPLEPEQSKLENIGELARQMFINPEAHGKRQKLSIQLGVSLMSLQLLGVGVGYDYDGTEFMSFPSRGSNGKIVGITRRYWDGSKKTMARTSNGIFLIPFWWKRTGAICIVEGASDVAALWTHGFCCLGRPSNIGGAEILAKFLARRGKGRQVVVVGENDRKPDRVGKIEGCKQDCPGCAWCWPGRYGAMTVAKFLGADWRMLPGVYKDAREWSAVNGFSDEFSEWLK